MPETSPHPGFSPLAPQHHPPLPGGEQPPMSWAQLHRFSFPPDHQALYSPACRSPFPFSLHLPEKNVSTEENAIELKEKWKEAPQNLLDRHFLC